MKYIKYCDVKLIAKICIGLLVTSLLVLFLADFDFGLLRGSVEIDNRFEIIEIDDSLREKLIEEVLEKKFNN